MEISKTEFSVMEAIWQQFPCTAGEVVERLNQHEEWHEKTVKTLIGRLVKKGALSFEKQGRQYLYSALIQQDEYELKESQSFVNRLFGGKLSPLVATFAKQNTLNEADVAELKKIIANWEKDND